MLEHIFLARIRYVTHIIINSDLGFIPNMIRDRLLELVHKHPFTQASLLSPPTTASNSFSTHPHFTTALHSALLVRVQDEDQPVLLADAFSIKVKEGEFAELWAKITSATSKAGSELPLGNVLTNETLRLLSLVADKTKEEVKSPAFSVISLVEPRHQRLPLVQRPALP